MIGLVPMTPRLWGERGRRRAMKLGIDPARLPPGQSPTTKFPVLTVGPNAPVPLDRWLLSVHGEADAPFVLRWDELMALEQVDVTCDIHCVTRWSKFDTRWRGVRVRTLLERARPRPGATHVMVHSHGGYTTNVPLDALLDDDVLVAHSFDDAPLDPTTAARRACSCPAATSGSRPSSSGAGAHGRRSAGLLGGQRLPQRRRPLARGAPQRRPVHRARPAALGARPVELPRAAAHRRTGLVGSALLPRLTAAGRPVRCLVRDPRRLGAERVRVQLALGDLSDPPSFRNALRGVDTVVHLAAAIRDQPGGSIEELNAVATWRMVQAAHTGRRRALRLLQRPERVGAQPDALHARQGAGRARGRRVGRPAHDLRAVDRLRARRRLPDPARAHGAAPVVPISGSGRALFQPIWAQDVADCVMAALERPEAPSATSCRAPRP